MELSIQSFDQICRACLCTSNNMKSLFTKIEGDNQILLDLFVLVANLDASTEDEMPKQVCDRCELILYRHDEFRKRCFISDDLLKKVLSDTIQFDAITIETCSDADLELQDFEKKELSDSNESFASNAANNHSSDITELDENGQGLVHFDNTEPLEMLPTEYEETTKKTQNKTEILDPVKYEYSCQLCNVNFLDRSNFENHLDTHQYIKEKRKTQRKLSNQCSLCPRSCRTKENLSKHMKSHENAKYSCDTCKREFTYKTHLKKHIISVHMHNVQIDWQTDLRHICGVCGNGYKMLCSLKDHMRKHTGEKPFLCYICGKAFSQKTNLALHTRRHLGDKPFKCANCDKSFVSKSELQVHSRKHSGVHPFVCDDCNSGFTTSSSLLKHKRKQTCSTYTDLQSFVCEDCGRGFTTSSALLKHKRKHTHSTAAVDLQHEEHSSSIDTHIRRQGLQQRKHNVKRTAQA